MTFDIILCYYDNPLTLHNWLARLLHHSDFLQFGDQGNIIVTDTGTPRERVPATLEVLRSWQHLKKAIYVRAETEHIRAMFPPDVEVRPGAISYNVALRISKADLLICSILPHIFLPSYFRTTLAIHEANPRVFLQPFQFRLTSETYHLFYYDRPLEEALLCGIVEPWNGMPDPSVRREHLLAVGGWDEEMVTWGMADIDICTRLTGKIDFGIPAHIWHLNWCGKPREPYVNYGLEFARPYTPQFYSLFCKEYPGSTPYGSTGRNKGQYFTLMQYLNKWGKIMRNENAPPIRYEIHDY